MSIYESKLRVGETLYGKGVFAERRYRKNQSIGLMEGTVITDGDYDDDYCVDFGDDTVLMPGEPFRYLNHSCEPNCELVMWHTEEGAVKPEVWVHATRAIQPGDQLTINYRWPEDAFACLCGTPSCAG